MFASTSPPAIQGSSWHGRPRRHLHHDRRCGRAAASTSSDDGGDGIISSNAAPRVHRRTRARLRRRGSRFLPAGAAGSSAARFGAAASRAFEAGCGATRRRDRAERGLYRLLRSGGVPSSQRLARPGARRRGLLRGTADLLHRGASLVAGLSWAGPSSCLSCSNASTAPFGAAWRALGHAGVLSGTLTVFL